jgi:non-ribosomal peptide synthetase component F
MMFNTGDLGRWNNLGQLEHLGRLDDQVKIKVITLCTTLYFYTSMLDYI